MRVAVVHAWRRMLAWHAVPCRTDLHTHTNKGMNVHNETCRQGPLMMQVLVMPHRTVMHGV
jgi:hypothetical protein